MKENNLMNILKLALLAGAIASGEEAPTSQPSESVVEDEPSTSVVAPSSSEEQSSSSEESSSSSSASSSEEEQEPTFDDFKAEVEAWLSQYLEKDLLTQIISWAVDAGVLGGLFTVYLKYRKYKNKTIGQLVEEIKANVTKQMEDDFKNLSQEQQQKLINGIETLKKSNELVIKALVLAQSKTTENKLALLDLVGEANTDVEVKQAVESVRQEVEANQETKENVQEVVKDDYHPID